MINFRFHLVSLVAIFLALGVGVAMGASFVDRATVETLRDRLDQLEGNYRDRGGQIDELRAALRGQDERVAALAAEGSTLLAGRLAQRNVVLVAPAGMDDDAVDATWSVLRSAGANRAGTLRVQPAVTLSDDAALAAVRDLLDLDSATTELVRGRLVTRLASALAALTASAPAPGAPPGSPDGSVPDGSVPDGTPTTQPTTSTTTTTIPPFRPLGPSPTAADVAAARGFVSALVDAGILSLDTDGAAAGTAFPATEEVTYVVLLEQGTAEDVVSVLHRLSREVAEAAPATVTVAEAGAPRPAGELPDTDPDRIGSLLVALRNDDEAVERLSTVDGLEETVGRLVLVLAVEEQFGGAVGHYGTGPGATAAVPTTEG